MTESKIHSLGIPNFSNNLIHKIEINGLSILLYLAYEVVVNIALIGGNFLNDSIWKSTLNVADNMRSSRDIDSDFSTLELLYQIKDISLHILVAFIDSVEKYSNFDKLGALYQYIDDYVSSWPIVSLFNLFVHVFEIRAVFLRRKGQLLEETSSNFVRHLGGSGFQIEVYVDWYDG
jgi:hypothetical protein